MQKILFGTNNQGKLQDARRIAGELGYTILSLKDLGIDIDVVEDGTTFEENAIKKYNAFCKMVDDPDIWIISDDSGIEITALNNEPGVYSRRWAGHEMIDQEIIDFCMIKMEGVQDRSARFRGVMAIGKQGIEPHFISFVLQGELLNEPDGTELEPGLPFRSLFYVPKYGKMLREVHATPFDKRPGLLTHREQGLKDAIEYINSGNVI